MSIFGGGKTAPPPTPAPLPPAPERSDAQTQELAATQRKKFALSGDGRASTFLTSGGTSQGYSAVRYLGGAGKT